jgi:hypothetical protein
VKGFRKHCISTAVDGTGGNVLWSGSEGNGGVRGECEQGGGM